MIGRRPQAGLIGGGEHLPAARIAELAELACRGDLVLEDHPHLIGCRRCFATFTELARTQIAHASGQTDIAVPADLLEVGRRIGEQAQPAVESRRTAGARESRPIRARETCGWIHRRAAVGLLAASVAAVLLWTSVPDRSPGVDPRLVASVRTLVCEDSAHGLLHSGCAGAGSAAVPDSYRAGGSAWTGDARAALERMAATYSDHAPPAEEAYWLAAGYLALSELDIARTYLMEARRLHPSDRRIELITAHLAYKLSDLAEAQAILEKMVREDPGDGLALLNLGIVLSERGDPRSGRVLRDVQRRFAGTPLAGRAGRELSRR